MHGAPAASCVEWKTHELVTTGTPKQSGTPCATRRFQANARRGGSVGTVMSAIPRSARFLRRGCVVKEEERNFEMLLPSN
jgi:hypothetical protein